MLTGEIDTNAALHPSGRWITIDVGIAAHVLSMVLDTGAQVSALSPSTRADLERRGLLGLSRRPNLFRLGSLTIEGRAIPDLEVGVAARLDRLQVVGLLGLDFLGLFEDLHFNVPSLRLRLIPPAR
jgi:hypothetical protein